MAITTQSQKAATWPFWHRAEPVAATVRIDPDYQMLREEFPDTWQHLVRAKLCLDCVATLDRPNVVTDREYDAQARRLFRETAGNLAAFADGESDGEVAEQARQLVDTLVRFAETGEWPPFVVRPPRRSARWLYCGPLGTWAENEVRNPVSLLVTVHDPVPQRAVDHVTDEREKVVAEVALTLGAVADDEAPIPAMYTSTLLLAGGHSAFGHKNFAHFFPLESPGGKVEAEDFTVVFTNIHRERLRRCSLPLLEDVLEAPVTHDLEEVLAASLRWFRAHDLGHFWRRTSGSVRTEPSTELDAFGLMALEEAYADSLGLLCAAELGDQPALVVAFCAELVRYLSRDQASFADSVAAALEVGWLMSRTGEWRPLDSQWCKNAVYHLRELVPVLHDVLWAGLTDTEELVSAVAVGRADALGRDRTFRRVPTDLVYTFG